MRKGTVFVRSQVDTCATISRILTSNIVGLCVCLSVCVCVCVCVCVYLLRSSTARKEVSIVVAMQGDVEDVGVTVEGLLGAVAMVNVLQ